MRVLLFTLITVLISISSQVRADNKNEPENCSKVIFNKAEIVCLQKGIGSISLKERVELIQKRISSLSSDLTFDINKIQATELEDSANIVAGDTIILSLTDGDIPGMKSHSYLYTAEAISHRIKEAIENDRQNKSPKALLIGFGYSLIATLFLITLLYTFKWAYPKIYRNIRAIDGKYVKTLKIQSFEILNSSRIISFFMWLAYVSRIALTLIIFYIYIPLVFSFFPWTKDWAPKLFGYIIDPLSTIFRVIINFIPNLFFIFAIYLVTHYALQVIRFFFREIESGSLQIEGFYKEWADPTYKLVRIFVYAFALVMVFPYLPGSESAAFQGVSVFLGVLLSFGSSSAIANIVSGVVLTYMRPFKEGDRVKIADTIGDVLEKTLLVTRIQSIKNVEITIPNSMVLGSHIINYSATAEKQGLILNSTITLGYETPWVTVHKLLIEAALRTNLIDEARKPFVLQTALNDFTVSYEINAYTSHPNKMAEIYSELNQNIQDCFNENGIEIMSPQYSNLRDGNTTTIPESYRNKDYKAPGIKVEMIKKD